MDEYTDGCILQSQNQKNSLVTRKKLNWGWKLRTRRGHRRKRRGAIPVAAAASLVGAENKTRRDGKGTRRPFHQLRPQRCRGFQPMPSSRRSGGRVSQWRDRCRSFSPAPRLVANCLPVYLPSHTADSLKCVRVALRRSGVTANSPHSFSPPVSVAAFPSRNGKLLMEREGEKPQILLKGFNEVGFFF